MRMPRAHMSFVSFVSLVGFMFARLCGVCWICFLSSLLVSCLPICVVSVRFAFLLSSVIYVV